jgi:hypothetical protein
MKKALSKNEFIAGICQILQDYRDVLSFQDRVILNRKFTRKGVVSLATQDVVSELDCNWTDVSNAIQKLINILRVKNKWMAEQVEDLTQTNEEKNAPIINWLNGHRRQNGQMAAQLSALRDEEKKVDEKARQAWRVDRAQQQGSKKR